MDKAKTYRRRQTSAKERWAHSCGAQKTIATHESSVGSEKKSRWQIGAKERRNHPCWTEEAFPTYESPVGGEEESSRQQITYDLRLRLILSTSSANGPQQSVRLRPTKQRFTITRHDLLHGG
jgi:hypothetical protein